MWSDRLAPSSRQAFVEGLRHVLAAPRPDRPSYAASLSWDGEAIDGAAALWAQRHFLWLDQPPTARLAVDPVARLTVTDGMATIQGPNRKVSVETRGFDLVEAALEAWGGPSEALVAGYLGYELGCEIEDVVTPERRVGDPPDLDLRLYDWWLELGRRGWRFHGTEAWRDVGPKRAEELLGRRRPVYRQERAQGAISRTPSDQDFCDAVARTVERIGRGELFQVNLCRRLEAALPVSSIWPLYLRLRAISPASQGAVMRTGSEGAVLSVSPELFVRVSRGRVHSCPIKGTRPRGCNPEQDRALRSALAGSEKDQAELAMIVDVTRNDLGRVCAAGSVEVTRHAELMPLPTVQHTYSEVSGRLRADCGPADLLRACFPPASITGAPKIRAMELAALEEGYRRGPAMGSIGWISLDGDMEWSVAIRTAVAAKGRIWYLAGCGITAESVPEEELAESDVKAAAFLEALSGLSGLPSQEPIRSKG